MSARKMVQEAFSVELNSKNRPQSIKLNQSIQLSKLTQQQKLSYQSPVLSTLPTKSVAAVAPSLAPSLAPTAAAIERKKKIPICWQGFILPKKNNVAINIGPIIGLVTNTTARILVESNLGGFVTMTVTAKNRSTGEMLHVVRSKHCLMEKVPHVFSFSELLPRTTYYILCDVPVTRLSSSHFTTLPIELDVAQRPIIIAAVGSSHVIRENNEEEESTNYDSLVPEVPSSLPKNLYINGARENIDMLVRLGESSFCGLEVVFRKAMEVALSSDLRSSYHAICEVFRNEYRQFYNEVWNKHVMATLPSIGIMGFNDLPNTDDLMQDGEYMMAMHKATHQFVLLCAYEVYCEYEVALYEDYNTYSILREWESAGRNFTVRFPRSTHHFHHLGDLGLMMLDNVTVSKFDVNNTHMTLLVSEIFKRRQWEDIQEALCNNGLFNDVKHLIVFTNGSLTDFKSVWYDTDYSRQECGRLLHALVSWPLDAPLAHRSVTLISAFDGGVTSIHDIIDPDFPSPLFRGIRELRLGNYTAKIVHRQPNQQQGKHHNSDEKSTTQKQLDSAKTNTDEVRKNCCQRRERNVETLPFPYDHESFVPLCEITKFKFSKDMEAIVSSITNPQETSTYQVNPYFEINGKYYPRIKGSDSLSDQIAGSADFDINDYDGIVRSGEETTVTTTTEGTKRGLRASIDRLRTIKAIVTWRQFSHRRPSAEFPSHVFTDTDQKRGRRKSWMSDSHRSLRGLPITSKRTTPSKESIQQFKRAILLLAVRRAREKYLKSKLTNIKTKTKEVARNATSEVSQSASKSFLFPLLDMGLVKKADQRGRGYDAGLVSATQMKQPQPLTVKDSTSRPLTSPFVTLTANRPKSIKSDKTTTENESSKKALIAKPSHIVNLSSLTEGKLAEMTVQDRIKYRRRIRQQLSVDSASDKDASPELDEVMKKAVEELLSNGDLEEILRRGDLEEILHRGDLEEILHRGDLDKVLEKDLDKALAAAVNSEDPERMKRVPPTKLMRIRIQDNINKPSYALLKLSSDIYLPESPDEANMRVKGLEHYVNRPISTAVIVFDNGLETKRSQPVHSDRYIGVQTTCVGHSYPLLD